MAVAERDVAGYLEDLSSVVVGWSGEDTGNAGMRYCDQPCALVGVSSRRCLHVQRVERFGGPPSLIETGAVGRLDLAFLHPLGVGVVAAWGAEVVVAVDQVWAVDTGRDDHRRRPRVGAEVVHLQPKHWRRDRRDGHFAIGPLMVLGELTGVFSLGRGLLLLLDAVHDHAAAAVGHSRDVLGHIGLREIADGRQFRLPVQVIGFDYAGGHSLIEHRIGKGTGRQPQHTV